MSTHETIVSDINRLIEQQAGVDILSPTYIARELFSSWSGEDPDPRIAFTSLEHIKQMARRVLGGRYGSEEDGPDTTQGELFSGKLQVRYPVPHKHGDEPTYKRLEALTADEARWNADTLRKSGIARLDHARALEAWAMAREAA